MPTYSAQCSSCGDLKDYIQPISRHDVTPECCGAGMRKVITQAPLSYMKGKFEAFRSTVDGSLITGDRSLREHNKRNNVVSLSDGYSDEKIRKGSFSRPKEPSAEQRAREVAQDLAESISMVANGYKPITEVHND